MQFTMYSGFSERLAQYGIEKVAKLATETGFSSVEFLEYLLGDRELIVPDTASASKIKKELDKHNLTTACYSAVANIWREQTTKQDFQKALEIAAELGAPYFHHTLLPWVKPPTDAPSFEDGIKLAIEAAIKVADYAKPLGITCIYEDQGQYVNGVSGFGAFYWELKKNCSNVGICGDLGNILLADEKPEDFLAAFKYEIAHVHMKDYAYINDCDTPGKNCWPDRSNRWLCVADVGTGIVDFKACMKVLKESGYNGSYSLELNVPDPYKENMQLVMEYLRKSLSDN